MREFEFEGAEGYTSAAALACITRDEEGEGRPRSQLANVRTDIDGLLGDHGTVCFVDDAVDLLQVVGVGDDLVIGEDILCDFTGLAQRIAVAARRIGGGMEGEMAG